MVTTIGGCVPSVLDARKCVGYLTIINQNTRAESKQYVYAIKKKKEKVEK